MHVLPARSKSSLAPSLAPPSAGEGRWDVWRYYARRSGWRGKGTSCWAAGAASHHWCLGRSENLTKGAVLRKTRSSTAKRKKTHSHVRAFWLWAGRKNWTSSGPLTTSSRARRFGISVELPGDPCLGRRCANEKPVLLRTRSDVEQMKPRQDH